MYVYAILDEYVTDGKKVKQVWMRYRWIEREKEKVMVIECGIT